MSRVFSDRLAILLLTLINLGALAAFFLHFLKSHQELEFRVADIEHELKELDSENKVTKTKNREPEEKLLPRSKVPFRLTLTPEPRARLDASDDAQKTKGPSDWLSNEMTLGVEKLVALNPDEKRTLKGRIQDKLGAGLVPELAQKEALFEVLGQERAEKFRTLRIQAEEQEKRDRLEQELFALTRKLKLRPDQEPKVAAVLSGVDPEVEAMSIEMNKRIQEITAQHFDPKTRADQMKSAFEEVRAINQAKSKTKQTLLAERLRPLLSDEQYNDLLALQASQSESFE